MSAILAATLRLEPLCAAHADEMFAPMSAAEIYAFIPEPRPDSVAALRRRYAQLERGGSADGTERWFNWVVRVPTGACAGFVQATVYTASAPPTADFAFALTPAHWGKGIAHDASQAALGWLVTEFGVAAFYATVDPANNRSLRLLERLGFDEIAASAYPHGDVTPNDRVFALNVAAPGDTD